MIFNLPPLLGLLPLLLYIYLMITGKDMVWSVLISAVFGGILTGVTLLQIGPIMQGAIGSFLALIGFIIMLGAGLGEVLTRSKVAPNVVHIVIEKANIKTQTRAIVVTMLISTLLVAMLGTLAGANAILAPIVIPVVASLKISRSTLGVIFQGAGAVGLMTGPFVPPVVTVLGLTGVSYGAYLLAGGIPLAIILWVCTFFVAKRVQKKTETVTPYSDEDRVSEKFEVTGRVKAATAVFVIGMVLLLGYGIWQGVGASYAIPVMLIMSFAVGLTSGMKPAEILQAIIAGCARLFPLYLLFVLFDPLMRFITESGAFVALAELLQPIIDMGGQIGFMFVTTVISVFGIPGAAVTATIVKDEMFGPMAASLGIPIAMWAMALMAGGQITSFAYPGGDMLGQMGLARSQDLRAMMKSGISITVASILFIVVRTVILVLFGG